MIDDNESFFREFFYLRISRINEDKIDVKLLFEILENHYRYPLAFDASDLYSNRK